MSFMISVHPIFPLIRIMPGTGEAEVFPPCLLDAEPVREDMRDSSPQRRVVVRLSEHFSASESGISR